MRGTRSAGYGFVGLATEEAAKKAVELLNKKELEGREVIIEIAKPSDQKDKERKEKKANKKASKRAKAADAAQANGDAAPASAEGAPAAGDAAKPKKKKKAPVCSIPLVDLRVLII